VRNSFTFPSKVRLNCADFQKNAYSTESTEKITCTKLYPKQKINKIYAKFNFSSPLTAPLSQN